MAARLITATGLYVVAFALTLYVSAKAGTQYWIDGAAVTVWIAASWELAHAGR